MKIKTKSNTGKKIAITSTIIVLVAVAAASTYFYFHHSDQQPVQKPHIDLNPPTKEQVKAGEQTKKQSVDSAIKPTNSDSSDQPSSGSSLKTEITAASVQGGTLYIRNSINGIYQDGTCTLTLTKGSSVITQTAGIQPLPQSSTCRGFNVTTSQLSSGTWTIKITVTIGSQSATATGSVAV